MTESYSPWRRPIVGDTCRKGERIRTVVGVSEQFHLMIYEDNDGARHQIRWPSWWSWCYDSDEYVEA